MAHEKGGFNIFRRFRLAHLGKSDYSAALSPSHFSVAVPCLCIRFRGQQQVFQPSFPIAAEASCSICAASPLKNADA